MGNLLQDVRYGLRNLARNPGFTLVAMLTLALGIGANTTIFSVIDNTLLKPLPFPGADRLLLVWETFGKGPDNWNIVSAPNFWDFERLAAVAFVLLIACVNVANLLLARGAARQKEFAIRRAVGTAGSRIAPVAYRERLAGARGWGGRAAAGCREHAGAVLCCQAGFSPPAAALHRFDRDGRPRVRICPARFLPDGRAVRRSASTGGRNRLRHVLVASEVALAMVVLSGAGLMIKSMTRLLGVDPGLNPRNVLTVGMSVPQEEIYVGPPGLPRFCQDLDEHVGAIPD